MKLIKEYKLIENSLRSYDNVQTLSININKKKLTQIIHKNDIKFTLI